ncbi:MAG TPA: hypothetical protein VJT50_00595 [Pyrinomonadaceae bacterium]|nr:hypothetical protein [Pyrinomonadaceae bacterium]
MPFVGRKSYVRLTNAITLPATYALPINHTGPHPGSGVPHNGRGVSTGLAFS